MMVTDAKKEWREYVASEKRRTIPLLAELGFTLDEEQPQTIGERYLTRPVGSGRKVVFFGRQGETRAVIKISGESQGRDELLFEKHVHDMLTHITFAYDMFALPAILHFNNAQGILITEYIEQEKPFLDRPLKEQFAIALNAFKSQEHTHATTAEHWTALEQLMATHVHFIKPGEYRKIGTYAMDLLPLLDPDTTLYKKNNVLIDQVIHEIHANKTMLERYDGFLTHWDFTPQNFRIRDGKLYLLDLTSMRFGNKYESWARFINFMMLYNPELAQALVDYVRLNRPEEIKVLKIMRAYRLIELIRYYATWLSKTKGDTQKLANVRIAFWTKALECVLTDKKIPMETIAEYKEKRDQLRTPDEKKRQQGLH